MKIFNNNFFPRFSMFNADQDPLRGQELDFENAFFNINLGQNCMDELMLNAQNSAQSKLSV